MIDVIDLFNACLYIQDNLETDLSLMLLARTVGLSRFRFHRVFKAWRGETLHEFVTRMRMERAAFELTYPLPRSRRRSIKAIAFASGYKSLSSFSHAFSAYAQISPREFRNRALRRRPNVSRAQADPRSIGAFGVSVREEPERVIAVLDPAGMTENSGRAGKRAARPSAPPPTGDRFAVELLPNLFVRSRRDRRLWARAAPTSCIGVDLEDWRRSAARKTRSHALPRTTITLDGGRYAVVEGRGAVRWVYRACCRSFDAWLAVTGECPRPGRIYMRLDGDADLSSADLRYSLYIPLEDLPARPATSRG